MQEETPNPTGFLFKKVNGPNKEVETQNKDNQKTPATEENMQMIESKEKKFSGFRTSKNPLTKIKTLKFEKNTKGLQFRLYAKWSTFFYLIFLIFYLSALFMQIDIELRYKIRKGFYNIFEWNDQNNFVLLEHIWIVCKYLINPINDYPYIRNRKFKIISDLRVTQRQVKLTNSKYPVMSLITDQVEFPQWASSGVKPFDYSNSNIEETAPFGPTQQYTYSKENSFWGRGGYVMSFDTNKLEIPTDFFVDQTTAITLDFLVVNFELNFISNVIITFDINQIGIGRKYMAIYSMNKNFYSSGWAYTRVAFECVALLSFIVYVILFMISLNYKASFVCSHHRLKKRWIEFCKFLFLKVLNVSQFISIITTVICIILWAVYISLINKDLNDINLVFELKKKITYDLQNKIGYACYFLEIYRGFSTFNLLFVFARLIQAASHMLPSTRLFVKTLKRSLSDVFSFYVFYLCVVFGFALFSWVFYCRWMNEFNSLSLAFQQNWAFALGIINNDIFLKMYDENAVMTVFYFLFLIIMLRFLIAKILLGTILFYFTQVNTQLIAQKELTMAENLNESIIFPTTLYKTLLTYSKLINRLCDMVICKCSKKKKKHSDDIVIDYSDLTEFTCWRTVNYLCPEIRIRELVSGDRENEPNGKQRAVKIANIHLYNAQYNEDYEFSIRNAYFDSEKDCEKVKRYFEEKYKKKFVHSLIYIIFTVVVIVMYLMNILSPWRLNLYHYIGKTLSILGFEIENFTTYNFFNEYLWDNQALNKFMFKDIMIYFKYDEKMKKYRFLNQNLVLNDQILLTVQKIKNIEEIKITDNVKIRSYEVLNEDRLYYDDRNFFDITAGDKCYPFSWSKDYSYNNYGGFYHVRDLHAKDSDYPDEFAKFFDTNTAFATLEFFLQNREYEVGMYVKIKVTADYGSVYIPTYQTYLLKYTTTQKPLDIVKYVAEVIFLLLFIYLIYDLVTHFIEQFNGYNKWYKDIIMPLNLKVKDLRNRAEPEFLRKFSFMINISTIIDITIICLCVGLIATRIIFWKCEAKLNKVMNEPENYKDIFEIRNLFYDGIAGKNNYEIIGCIIIFLACLKFISLFNLGRYFSILEKTLEDSQINNFSFIIFLLLCHFTFVLYAHLSFGDKNINFYKLESSIKMVAQFLGGYLDFKMLENCNEGFGPIFFFVYSILVNMILLNIFLAIVYTSYYKMKQKISKTSNLKSWKNIICFCCTKREGSKTDKQLTLDSQFEYEKQKIKYQSVLMFNNDKLTVKDWIKHETDQISIIDEQLSVLKRQKSDMDKANDSTKSGRDYTFEDNIYNDITNNHYRSFYINYLNHMLTISEELEKDIKAIDQYTIHLNEHDDYINYDVLTEKIEKKHDILLTKIAEIDKNFVEMKMDLEKIYELNKPSGEKKLNDNMNQENYEESEKDKNEDDNSILDLTPSSKSNESSFN